jgi:NAD(P)-dependent dehydrogenase (short-subunit alcohol dehydrogenase family)
MLKGKIAVVTGGSHGIGAATVRLLASQGASASIFDREPPQSTGDGQYIPVDVTNRSSIDAAFAATGAPDILVVNAGTAEESAFLEHSGESWERILAVNLTGAFHTIQSAARLMKKRQSGAIVVTASTNSYDGEARLAAYNASKAGLLGLIHTAANELGPIRFVSTQYVPD